ncbi:MAG: NUDIX domain-containing protein [bacterium]|nr:NUDIX domain-containing protein [bacterium]
MKREFSAGGIVYKKIGSESDELSSRGRAEGEVLWLIRRPTGSRGYRGNLGWSFPKGWPEQGESPEETALRETAEEGGVRAKIVKPLPEVKFFFKDYETGQTIEKTVSYFLMEWLEDLAEGFCWETKEARWVGFREAQKLLAYENDKELLKQAAEKIIS